VVRTWRFITLFRRLFGPAEKLDTREIESMGLLAVKIAQMYAIRGDLLGPEKTAKLARLYEQATPMAADDFMAAYEREAPEALKRELVSLDREPLAAASLGQVHRGRLRDGREVVVKVLRADHAADFQRDAAAVRSLARLAVTFYPPLERLADPLGTLDNVVKMTTTEMDLSAELRGTRRLTELRDAGKDRLPHLADLHFPEVFGEFTRPGIMVAEYVPAPSVRSLLKDGAFSYDSLLKLFRLHGYFLFHLGEFHGDFHPGNIHHDGERFWFIDNANVEKVDRRFSQGLLSFMVHLGQGDHRAAASALQSLALEPLRDPSEFERRFAGLYRDFGGRPIGEQSLTRQMMRTIRMAVECGMTFPKGAFPVIKSLMYLDGMALECAPERVLLDDVARFAGDFA
jgi:ubiquinone biosynthesis protein